MTAFTRAYWELAKVTCNLLIVAPSRVENLKGVLIESRSDSVNASLPNFGVMAVACVVHIMRPVMLSKTAGELLHSS